jgi:fatty acid desaturase
VESPHRTYVRELRKRLPPHVFRPVPVRAFWILPYALVGAAGTWAIAAWDLPVPARVLLGVTIGMAYASLGFLGHEILHGGVVRRPWVRDLLGAVCLLPSGIGPRLWRRWHNVEHHGHTQIVGRDPDAYSTLEQYHRRPALRLLHRLIPVRSVGFFAMLAVWLSVHSWIILVGALRREGGRERLLLLGQFAGPMATWTFLGWWLGWGALLYFYVIPLLVGNFVVMAYIATNHLLNPLLEEDDPLAGSLSVTVPRLLDVLHGNFSHHTEHHIFPAMSARYLPEVRRLLRELWPHRYHEMPLRRALGLLWRTPRLYLDNVRLVDPRSGHVSPVLGHGLRVEEFG